MSEAIRVAVGLLLSYYNSCSFFTIPHPPAVGAPFTQRGLIMSAIAEYSIVKNTVTL